MLTLILSAIAAAAVAGLAVKLLLDLRESASRITLREYLFGLSVISFVVAPASGYIGWKLVQADNLRFNETWHGWETQAVKQEIVCARDGPCVRTYNCDPYSCNPHSCFCICISRDKNGTCTSEICQTCYDTCYHHCPYVTHEYNYAVSSTVGDYTIASNVLPANPDSYRWAKTVAVPGDIIQGAGAGDPQQWTQAHDRLARESPGPASVRRQYDNYVLASEWTIVRESTVDVEAYRKRGILPDIPHAVIPPFAMDQVSFVGPLSLDRAAWRRGLEYLNSQLGTELQGDLYVTIVMHEAGAVEPDTYELALHAHWIDSDRFGKDSLAKNAIVLILGTTDGSSVSWVRAFTGMPKGNEAMVAAMRSRLAGAALNCPENILGRGTSSRVAGTIRRPIDTPPSIV